MAMAAGAWTAPAAPKTAPAPAPETAPAPAPAPEPAPAPATADEAVPEQRARRMRAIFALVDGDGSGAIDSEEVLAFVHLADKASTPERCVGERTRGRVAMSVVLAVQ